MYKYYLFDWDGTLVNTLPIWMKGYQHAFSSFGLTPSPIEIATQAFGDWNGCQKFGINDCEGFNKILTTQVYQTFTQTPFNPHVKELLDSIKRKNKTAALVTSSQRHVITEALTFHKLTNYFDCIITREDVTHHKPHPEPILKALDLLKASKESTLMVGDSQSDIQAAYEAGIASCLYQPDSYHNIYTYNYLKIYPATTIVKSFQELID